MNSRAELEKWVRRNVPRPHTASLIRLTVDAIDDIENRPAYGADWTDFLKALSLDLIAADMSEAAAESERNDREDERLRDEEDASAWYAAHPNQE